MISPSSSKRDLAMTGTLLVLSELPTGLAHPGCPSETELRGIISWGSGTQPAVLWPEIWEIWTFSFPFTSGTHGTDFPPGSGHSTTPSSPSSVSARYYFESWLLLSGSLQIIISSHNIYFLILMMRSDTSQCTCGSLDNQSLQCNVPNWLQQEMDQNFK